MKSTSFFAAALACAAIAGCGSRAEESLEPAPVAQLQGQWRMINRAVTCNSTYTAITPTHIVKVSDNAPRKKYAAIKKFAIGPGKVMMLTTGLASDPERELNLVFSLQDDQLRLDDLLGADNMSYKAPPATLEPAAQESAKAFFNIQQLRFAMDKCGAGA